MRELTPREIQEIQNTSDSFNLVNLREFYRKLNNALRTTHVQQAYHDATLAFWAFRRWEIFRKYSPNKIPRAITPDPGKEFVVPAQADSMDWRWDVIGRPPKYFQYVCATACHWMTEANLVLARQMFPKQNWVVISGERHTTVADLTNKLLFDLNYFALQVSAKEAALMLVDPNAGEPTYIYEDAETYSSSNLSITGPAQEFWRVIDQMPGSEADKLSLIQRATDATKPVISATLPLKTHLSLAKPLAELREAS